MMQRLQYEYVTKILQVKAETQFEFPCLPRKST
jgi:hypothetical protein